MNQSLLRSFFLDKHTKKEVFDFIYFNAKELAAEYAFKGQGTEGFKQLIEVLEDCERRLDEMFVVKEDKPTKNPAV
jgi:hypothetical protein